MEIITLTKAQFKELIDEAYQSGLEDAGKILIEIVCQRKATTLSTGEETT